MQAAHRFLIAAIVLGLLMTGPFWLTAALLVAELRPEEARVLSDVLLPRFPVGAFLTIIGFIIGLHRLRALFRQYVRGLSAMAESLRLMLGANRSYRVNVDGPPEIRQLAAAANALAQQRDDLLADVDAKVSLARTAVEEERNRLATLVADLPQAVIVCNLDGRITLYNNRARLQARALAPDAHAAGALIGLGRSIHAVFDPALIAHALETLHQRIERTGSQPLAHFVTATRAGQLIRVQMAPVLSAKPEEGARAIGGYVLTLENISRYLESDTKCDLMLQRLSDESRAAIGGIRARLHGLADGGEAVLGSIQGELDRLSSHLDAASHKYAETVRTRWPLEEMRGTDLVTAALRRIEKRVGVTVKLDQVEADLWVKVDSYSLTQATAFLALKLKDDYAIRLVHLRLSSTAPGAGRMVNLDMLWSGTAISTELLLNWQLEAMNLAGEESPLTLRDVADRHGGQIACGRESATQQSMFRLQIPVALEQELESPAALVHVESRPVFYDFDLFHRAGEDHALDNRRLSELSYTAFDTETTGLEPSAGDEIIQIGAVRIVNGRVLRHESIDQLIDPQRLLRAESIKIHGITAEMVDGQPTIDVVLPVFHRFAADTVLVAHNAAFDMRFLQMKEAATGLRFTQPVLDTLMLSAVVHPNHDSHKLEVIAERLGIPIIGRHNALGDAIVTAEVFVRLVTILADMGIHTLGEARAAAEKTVYAKIQY